MQDTVTLDQDLQRFRVVPWIAVRGDETLRLEYDLDENSVVLDVGGYHGDWTEPIFRRYGCVIHVFEPVREYAEGIKKRFADSSKIHVHAFGLSSESGLITVGLQENGTSAHKQTGDAPTEVVQMVRAGDFIMQERIGRIDLMKINIEGDEYGLLEHLIGDGLIQKVANIQVQFHDFAENARVRMEKIRASLKLTHYLTYEYEFVWENWRRKREPKDFQDAKRVLEEIYAHLESNSDQLRSARSDGVVLRRENEGLRGRLANCRAELERRQKEAVFLRHSMSYRLGHLLLSPIRFAMKSFLK